MTSDDDDDDDCDGKPRCYCVSTWWHGEAVGTDSGSGSGSSGRDSRDGLVIWYWYNNIVPAERSLRRSRLSVRASLRQTD